MPPGSPNPDPISDQKNVIFHTRFQTRPEIMLSLFTLERKQKNSSNPFRTRISLFLSYSFEIETINTFIHSRSSLENYTRFQTKIDKVYTCFRPKRPKNPTRWGGWGGTYLYNLNKGLPPPLSPSPSSRGLFSPEISKLESAVYSEQEISCLAHHFC